MSRCENRLGIRDEHLTRSTVNSRIRPYYDNRTHKILSSFLQKEKNQRKRTSRPATSFHSISSRSFDNLPLRYFPTTNSNVLKSNADRTATGHHRCVGQFLEGRRTVRPTVFPYHSPTIRSDSIPGGGIFSVRGARTIDEIRPSTRERSVLPGEWVWSHPKLELEQASSKWIDLRRHHSW